MKVTVVQFIAPNGRQEPTQVEVSDDLKAQYEAILECKCRLTAEVISGTNVSQTIEHDEGDFDIEICGFDKERAHEVLESLIRRFDVNAFHEWLKQFDEVEERA